MVRVYCDPNELGREHTIYKETILGHESPLEFDSDGYAEIHDPDRAEDLVRTTKVEYADIDENPTPNSDENSSSEEYPTNEDGEPLCDGKDDGQCNRVVKIPGTSCWQHRPD